MSFPTNYPYRNYGIPGDYQRGGRRLPIGWIILGVGALFLVSCCICLAVVYLTQANIIKVPNPLPSFASSTPTPDKNAQVPLKSTGTADNGLELTVVSVQRPLKVEGQINLPSDQQLVLVTVRLHNTKKSGTPIKVTAQDFKMKGDGGLTYDANPKAVTIPQLLSDTAIAPEKYLDGELIYQIAVNDSGLKLYWKVGSATRVFLLE